MVNLTSILIWATKSLTKQIMDFILQKNQKFIFAHGKILVDKKTLAKKKNRVYFRRRIQTSRLSIPLGGKQSIVL